MRVHDTASGREKRGGRIGCPHSYQNLARLLTPDNRCKRGAAHQHRYLGRDVREICAKTGTRARRLAQIGCAGLRAVRAKRILLFNAHHTHTHALTGVIWDVLRAKERDKSAQDGAPLTRPPGQRALPRRGFFFAPEAGSHSSTRLVY